MAKKVFMTGTTGFAPTVTVSDPIHSRHGFLGLTRRESSSSGSLPHAASVPTGDLGRGSRTPQDHRALPIYQRPGYTDRTHRPNKRSFL